MNEPTTYKTAPHKGSRNECCSASECESGLRNNYFEGKRLTADSFRVEQEYMLGRRRLLNRAMFGWGVVYGYNVSPVASNDPKNKVVCELKIGPGLALDKCGRELLQDETTIGIDDLIIDETDKRVPDKKDGGGEYRPQTQHASVIRAGLERLEHRIEQLHDHPPENKKTNWWLLSVHYAERPTGQVTIEDRCRCEHDEWNHTCETVRYSLRPIDLCCIDYDCELTCDCGTGDCCDEPKGAVADAARGDAHDSSNVPIDINKARKRGGCRCLCDYLTKLSPGGECKSLCEIDVPCGGSVLVDLKNGVPLACVEVIKDAECDQWTLGKVEVCGPRRLVKRNDLLFDLIRGCDLTRIKEIGWKQWHRQDISFDLFAKLFKPEDDDVDKPVKTEFWVDFSRPVRKETVRRDCFVITVIAAEGHDRWLETRRVPIVGVDFESTGTDANLIDRATIAVDGRWFHDTVSGAGSIFQGKYTRVELEVRGDFIVDCNGQTVDANPIGLTPSPTGNGTPGGTFLSTLRVGPAPDPVQSESQDRIKGVL